MNVRQIPVDHEVLYANDHELQILLDQARAGSRAAHEALLERQRKWITHWFQLRIPPALRPKVDADDLAQEAILLAWRCFGRCTADSVAGYCAWLVKVCRRCGWAAVEHFVEAKRRSVMREVPLDPSALDRGDQQPFRAELVDRSPFDSDEEVWERLLVNVPRRLRLMFLWHVRDHRSCAEIARDLDCCSRTVRRACRCVNRQLAQRFVTAAKTSQG